MTTKASSSDSSSSSSSSAYPALPPMLPDRIVVFTKRLLTSAEKVQLSNIQFTSVEFDGVVNENTKITDFPMHSAIIMNLNDLETRTYIRYRREWLTGQCVLYLMRGKQDKPDEKIKSIVRYVTYTLDVGAANLAKFLEFTAEAERCGLDPETGFLSQLMGCFRKAGSERASLV